MIREKNTSKKETVHRELPELEESVALDIQLLYTTGSMRVGAGEERGLSVKTSP